MDHGLNAVIAVIVAVVGLATVAVVLGTNSQAPTLITDTGTALSTVIQAAVQPVSAS